MMIWPKHIFWRNVRIASVQLSGNMFPFYLVFIICFCVTAKGQSSYEEILLELEQRIEQTLEQKFELKFEEKFTQYEDRIQQLEAEKAAGQG